MLRMTLASGECVGVSRSGKQEREVDRPARPAWGRDRRAALADGKCPGHQLIRVSLRVLIAQRMDIRAFPRPIR